ncbi:hypothetical protein TSUD_128230 [Trifolium subterraneum]|nr:hypothetical protein TSUD_128230 [Trifolium subterraneum]
MKRKGRNNILSREKNGKFKSEKQSCDPYLRICQHCLFNENNVMRRGPDGQKNLCNACGLFWKKTGTLKDLGMGRRYLSVDQSDLEPLIDVNITGLEGELPVIQNEQGISEDPLKAIATEGSNNHALYPHHEELPESLEHLTNTLGIDHSSQNDDEQVFLLNSVFYNVYLNNSYSQLTQLIATSSDEELHVFRGSGEGRVIVSISRYGLSIYLGGRPHLGCWHFSVRTFWVCRWSLFEVDCGGILSMICLEECVLGTTLLEHLFAQISSRTTP